MKIVIDIPEKAYNALMHTEFDANLVVNEMRKSIANGTPLPENATNRDVINNIFGKYFSIPLVTTEEWLNAPYEAERSKSE